jgi:hemolysin activation/secretion protein
LGAVAAAASLLLASPVVRAAPFQMNAVRIEGATVYKPGALAPAYDAYLTREVDTPELVKIASAITDRYRADGYFLSRAAVPPQLRGGRIAQIRVYEGYVGQVSVSGDGAAAASRLLKPIERRRPLRLSELQAALRLAAETPGVKLTYHLEPDADDPALHRLVVHTTRKRWTISTYVDNRGPKGAGPWQASIQAALNSVLRSGDQLALAIVAVPDHIKRFAYGGASYSAPVGQGWRLRGAFGVSGSSEGGVPVTKTAGGSSWEGTLGLEKVWTIGRRLRTWAELMVDRRHVEHHWTAATGYRDDLVVLRGRFGASYAKSGQSSNAFAEVSAGERRPQGSTGLTQMSRHDASWDFVKVSAHASHYRDLGKHAGVYVAADGQWSPDRLVFSEGFAVGGASYGRGYNYATLIGDKGVAGTVELRAGFDPKLRGISFLQAYGFVDAAKVWGGPLAQPQAIASAGGGVRARLANHATLGVEAARRLNRSWGDPKPGWRPSVYLSMEF